MATFNSNQQFNITQNNTTEADDFHARKPTTTLVIYGTMALFWFFYIIFLLKICRCYFKDKWLKEDLRALEDRKKRLRAIQNGRCLPGNAGPTIKCEENSKKPEHEKAEEKEGKETKVAFNIPENSEKPEDSLSKKKEPTLPKIDFVEYI